MEATQPKQNGGGRAGLNLLDPQNPSTPARSDRGESRTKRSESQQHDANEEIFRSDRAVQDILVQYSVRKNGCSYLKTRTHGLIQLVDISDALWDEALRQREAAKKQARIR